MCKAQGFHRKPVGLNELFDCFFSGSAGAKLIAILFGAWLDFFEVSNYVLNLVASNKE
jgi:hypothetical protein